MPLYPIIVLLLLQGADGLRSASAFVAGALAVRLAQGLVFGRLFGAAAEALPDDGPQIIASTLLLVLGILLLLAAFMKWRKLPDADEPPPQWMTVLGSLSPRKALGAGALLVAIAVKQWVFTLTAIDVIQGAGLGASASLGLYLAYTLATQVLVLPAILAMAIAPQRSIGSLQSAQSWLERYNRPIVIAVSLVFGGWFVYQGVAGLTA